MDDESKETTTPQTEDSQTSVPQSDSPTALLEEQLDDVLLFTELPSRCSNPSIKPFVDFGETPNPTKMFETTFDIESKRKPVGVEFGLLSLSPPKKFLSLYFFFCFS